ncbi:MAG: hypothetical protein K0R28_466 [Paenibacillus sp.]|nr:hypothetical protein [Paenibacillus sp.]
MKSKAVGCFVLIAIVLSMSMSFAVYGEEENVWQANNTAYLNSYWFSGVISLTDEQIKEKVLELRKYSIKYQLADIGVLVSSGDARNGTLPEEGYNQLARWIKISKETAPDQQIVVMVNDGKRTLWKNGKKIGNPNFGNAVYNSNLRAVADKMVNQGVAYNGNVYRADGIQLDIEGFLPNDPILKTTAEYVRGVLSNNAIYSIASPADSAVWSDAYVSEMAGIFNMLNPMMYDQMGYGSPVTSPETYQQFWKATVVRYARAIAHSGNPGTMLNPTMPAYEKKIAEDGTVYHDPAVENIYNAAIGLKLARDQLSLERAGDPSINPNGVHGSGIFWWSSFIMIEPDPRTGYNYAPDRQWWLEGWVRQN